MINNSREALTDLDLFYMGLTGPKFTWKGPKTSTDYTRAYINRVLIYAFLSNFPFCFLTNTSAAHSDTFLVLSG